MTPRRSPTRAPWGTVLLGAHPIGALWVIAPWGGALVSAAVVAVLLVALAARRVPEPEQP